MNADKIPFSFNLPFNQSPNYWLAAFPVGKNAAFAASLAGFGMKKLSIPGDEFYVIRTEGAWDAAWRSLRDLILKYDPKGATEVALIPGEREPDPQQFDLTRKSISTLDKVADSLWLGKAMLEDRIVCYMQPVLDKRGKMFGYEAFARMESPEGVVGGGKIIEAGRGLNAEYMLDRYLHLKAIKSFITSDLEGFLFINFIPGFIHRPEKYLEGLSDSARFHGMPAKRLVLDFTQSETPRDIMHLKAIFDYCRSKGYSLSLDDISSVAMAKKILDIIHPDYIKLDINLVRGATGVSEQNTIGELVGLAHASGSTVLAEGVETEEVHRELLRAGVDLFQGYLFSPPVAISSLKKAAV